jgi:hypothetical protein
VSISTGKLNITIPIMVKMTFLIQTVCCRGGIRGIVELGVLQAIEKKLGGKIPIRAFFDLIIGTK